MSSKVNLSNAYARTIHDIQLLMTLKGVEYEFEWYEPAVTALTGRVWLRVTTPVDKYTLVDFREIRHDQVRGFYRQYYAEDFTGGTVARTITPVKMRGDSTIESGATLEVLTGVTVAAADAFSQIPLWGAAGIGGRPQAGGLNAISALRVIPPGAVVLLEFENNSDAAAAWYAYFKQWEVFPSALPEIGDL